MTKYTFCFLPILILLLNFDLAAQISINNDGSSPNSSAMVDIKSTSKGFLPPRMTQVQRDNISSPVDGLVIFNTSSGCLNYFYDGFWFKT